MRSPAYSCSSRSSLRLARPRSSALRDDIDANLLALRLFKDSAAVSFRAQGRILAGACRLFVLAMVPMLAMAVPVTLVLGQLALWYQARPLRLGEDTVITLHLGGDGAADWPAVSLRPTDAVLVTVGPVRVQSKREVCWQVSPRQSGTHLLAFQVGGRVATKELAAGEGFMRVSRERPGWDFLSILRDPWERPFRRGDPVRSIEIAYPDRPSWTSGTDSWVIYWFGVSMLAALCFRRVLGVYV